MKPKISILVPVYNGATFLESCLASIFQQTLTDFEVLVSDDGSSDNSARLVQSFADPRLKFFHGPRKGLFANLNFLAGQATGELVRILCQDDRLKARCLEREYAFHQRHRLVTVTFCKASRIDGDDNLLSEPELNDLPEILSPDLAQQQFFYHGCIAGNLSTVCFRRSHFERYGKFDERLAVSGDYEFWARICEKEYLGIVQEPLVDLRVHLSQLSRDSRSLPKFVSENRRIRRQILARMPKGVRSKAARYERMRHDVMDFHAGLRSLLDGKLGVGASVLAQFVPLRGVTASFYWLWTGNNRFYRPQAPWQLTCAWPRQGEPSRVSEGRSTRSEAA